MNMPKSFLIPSLLGLMTGAGFNIAFSNSLPETNPKDISASDPKATSHRLNSSKLQSTANNLDFESLRAIAQQNPSSFLNSVNGFSIAFFEKGMGSTEDFNKLMLPHVNAALAALFEKSPDKAFNALFLLKERSYEISYAAMPSLIELGIASNPQSVIDGIRLFDPNLNFLGAKIAKIWAASDPAKAAAWSLTLNPGKSKASSSLEAALKVWVKNDPKAAQLWVSSLSDEKQKNKAQSSILEFLSEPSVQVAPLMDALVKSWESQGNASAIRGALVKWEKNDPAGLAAWLSKQVGSPYEERLIESVAVAKIISSPKESSKALGEISSTEARSSAVNQAVIRMLSDNHSNLDSTWKAISLIEDPALRTTGLSAMLSSGLISANDQKGKAMLAIVANSMGADPDSTIEALRVTPKSQIMKLRGLWTKSQIDQSFAGVPKDKVLLAIEAINSGTPLPK